MYYHHRSLSAKTLLIFLSAFVITFTFNVPYVFFHGLNGVGEVVNSLHFKADPDPKAAGFYKGTVSFALFSDNNTMVFRIPHGLKMIVRNWFINESGIPYKVDGWCIEPDSKGAYKASFYYNEPESYL